jgi:hypothetical protein
MRVCRALLAIAVVAMSTTSFAQEIALSPALRAGDAFRLESTRTRQNSARPQLDATSRTNIDVRVVTATPDGFVVEWGAAGTTFDNQQLAQDPLLIASSKALEGLRLRLQLNAEGELTGILNQDEVSSRLQAAVDVIVRGLMQTIPPEQQKGVQGLIAQALSPPALIGSATREAEIYFGLSGVGLSPGEAVETRIEQPSPLGGTLPAMFRVQLESATATSAVVTTTVTYDGAALVKMTRELVEQQSGKPIPAEELAKIPPFQMNDDAKYVFDRQLGLMREVVVNRRFSAGPQARLDRWEIRLVAPPRR